MRICVAWRQSMSAKAWQSPKQPVSLRARMLMLPAHHAQKTSFWLMPVPRLTFILRHEYRHTITCMLIYVKDFQAMRRRCQGA